MSRPLLMIPGPTEMEGDILEAMSRFGTSHVDPDFIECFGSCLEMLRKVFLAPDSQPFLLSSAASMSWDIIAANLLEAGDKALVLNIGYFGDRFGECLEAYGVEVTHHHSPVGGRPDPKEVAELVKDGKFKLVTITHVDTSTGVQGGLKELCAAIRAVNKDILIAADGVCALAGEEMRMQEWDLDAYLTGAQKAIGVPAGLAILVLSKRAMSVWQNRKSKVPMYFGSLARWLPIMQNYEARKPSYFSTPAVNNVYALRVGLKHLLENGGMEARFAEHAKVSKAFRAAMKALGLGFVPLDEAAAAVTMSAIRYPAGVDGNAFRASLKKAGIITAGGLHKDIKTEYFRVGHMGVSTRTPEHIEAAVKAVEEAMEANGCKFEKGAGLKALKEAMA